MLIGLSGIVGDGRGVEVGKGVLVDGMLVGGDIVGSRGGSGRLVGGGVGLFSAKRRSSSDGEVCS